MGRITRTWAGETVGIFALDPGTTSGWVEGVYELDIKQYDSSYDVVANGILAYGERRIPDMDDEIEAELECSALIAKQFIKFMAECNIDGISFQNIIFLYEDFILYPDTQHSSTRSGLSPARIMANIMGLLYSYKISYQRQLASLAFTKVTDDRLRRNELWVPGKQHVRATTKHVVCWVSRNL